MTIEVQPFARLLGYIVTGDVGGWTFYTSRRNKIVFFPQAPPTSPPSFGQAQQRNRMRQAGIFWKAQSEQQRTAWRSAAKKARLTIGGMALATAYIMRGDGQWLQTIAANAAISLPP